ncbi:MAG: DNA polymerase I, partial [Anaerococcus prevotii]|uniref:DNA polymerase I n=1 Tax=Anaerococcus prevotii TaxID=33034 RepID=UPI0028FE70C9
MMLMHYLIDPSRSSYDLKVLSQSYLDYEVKSPVDLLGKGKKALKYVDLDFDELGNYLASGINAIEDSKEILEDKLEEFHMLDLYNEIEIKLSKVLADMEIVGFVTDRKVLEDLKENIDKDIEKITEEIYELAGSEFNINSTKQLGEVLFKDLDLPVIKKTKTGFSTNAQVLEKLRDKHQIIPKIERYRELFKLRSTYIEGLEKAIDEDGRIRSTFRQNIAATGRLSSQDPNLQNLPIKTDEGRLIRKAFRAEEGKILIDADYSQIELRILASLSGDRHMIEAFKDGVDIHTKTASKVFHTDLDKVTKRQRSEAKAVNFGIIYGISDYGLSQNLNIPRKEAKEYIDNYMASYPSIKEYMDSIVEKAKEDGYVETLFKRRRYVPEINSRNFNVRSFGQRVALNTPIQGTAADIIKIAMIETDKNLKKAGLDAKIVLQIHDEIILEADESCKDEAIKILRESMEAAADLKVPLIVDIDTGVSMYESK